MHYCRKVGQAYGEAQSAQGGKPESHEKLREPYEAEHVAQRQVHWIVAAHKTKTQQHKGVWLPLYTAPWAGASGE